MEQMRPQPDEVLVEREVDVQPKEARWRFKDTLRDWQERRGGAFMSQLFGRKAETGPRPPDAPPPLFGNIIYVEPETVEASQPLEVPKPPEVANHEPVTVSIETIPVPKPEKKDKPQQAQEVDKADTNAETEEPTELDRELMHETKGENADEGPSITDTVKQILADIHKQTSALHAAFSQRIPSPTGGPLATQLAFLTNQPALYKQAILAGFGAAVVLLLGLLILN